MARACILAMILLAAACRGMAAEAVSGTVTILEGQALVYRGATRLQAQEGLRLMLGDIVATPASTLAQIELADKTVLQLGGDTQIMLGASTTRQKTVDRWVYLMDGWLKLVGVSGAADATPLELRAPLFELAAGPSALVVRASAAEATIFVERGSTHVTERPAADPPASVALEAGDSYRRAAGARGTVNPGSMQAFVAEMPRSFRDSLPLRIDRFRDADVQPRTAPDFAYADVEDWLNAEPWLRRQFVQRWRSKTRDAAFRSALVANLAAHPEWDPVLFPEKYRPKPPAPPRPAPAIALPAPTPAPMQLPAQVQVPTAASDPASLTTR